MSVRHSLCVWKCRQPASYRVLRKSKRKDFFFKVPRRWLARYHCNYLCIQSNIIYNLNCLYLFIVAFVIRNEIFKLKFIGNILCSYHGILISWESLCLTFFFSFYRFYTISIWRIVCKLFILKCCKLLHC